MNNGVRVNPLEILNVDGDWDWEWEQRLGQVFGRFWEGEIFSRDGRHMWADLKILGDNYQFMLILVLLSVLRLSVSQTNVTWVAFNFMQSGTINPIVSNTVTGMTANGTSSSRSTYKYAVTFPSKTFTAQTSVMIGIITLEIPATKNSAFLLINDHDNRTKTGFMYFLTVNQTNKIINLKVNYLCVDQDQMSALVLRRIIGDISDSSYNDNFYDTARSSGYRYTQFDVDMNTAINTSHTIISIVAIKAFVLNSLADGAFSIGMLNKITSSITSKITIWTWGSCQLSYAEYYSLLIDKDKVQVDQKYFMDYGTIQGSKSVQSTDLNSLTLVPNGYIFALNYLSFNFSNSQNQGFQLDLSNKNLSATSTYDYLNISYFSFKERGCPTSDPNYYNPTQLCYDICPNRTFVNVSYKYCDDCKISCFQCTNKTSCTACSADSFRTISSGQCVCIAGYVDAGDYICKACVDGCTSCTTSKCTTCNTTAGYGGTPDANGTCLCNSTSFSLNKVCSLCSSVLLGCNACSNNSACKANSCLNGNYTYNSSNSLCQCTKGYIKIGLKCELCSEQMVGCTECSSTTVCTNCSTSFVLENQGCVCSSDKYLDTATTQCKQCDFNCLTCSGTGTDKCLSCLSFLNYDSAANTCNCDSPSYVSNGTTCISCSDLCGSLTCTGSMTSPCKLCNCPCKHGFYPPVDPLATECLECDITNLASSSPQCSCPLKTYPDASNNNNSCLSCHYSCLFCSSSDNTSCTQCVPNDHRTLINSSCICDPFYMDSNINQSLCITLVCDLGYSQTSEGYCAPVCGDGLVAPEEACDDNNTVQGDGCDTKCEVETNFTCSGNLTTPSACHYSVPLELEMVSIVKSPTSNNLTYTINLKPNISTLGDLNFSQIIDLGLPNNTLTTYTYNNGVLTVQAQYFENLQQIPANITFRPSNSNNTMFSQTPQSVLGYKVEPVNNLAADVYPDELYSHTKIMEYACLGLVGLAFATYALALYAGKLIGTETLWVVQLGFAGLILLDFSDPLYGPMRKLNFIQGYSLKFSDIQTGLPYRIQSLGYFNSLINNFNVMVVLEVIIGLIALSLFIASKFVKDDALKTKLNSYSKRVIGEIMLTAALFSIYQYSISLCILVQYPFEKGLMLYASLGEAAIFGSCVLAVVILYFLKSKDLFGEYKTSFKETKFYQAFFVIPILFKIVIGAALGMFNGVFIGGIFALGIIAVELILTAAFRPYLQNKHTIRQCVNLGIAGIVVALYVFFGKKKGSEMFTLAYYVPYLIVGLLLGTVIMNLAFLIQKMVNDCQSSKKAKMEKQKLQQQQQLQLDNKNELALIEEQTKRLLANKPSAFKRKKPGKLKSKSTKNKLESVEPVLSPDLLSPTKTEKQPLVTSKMEQFENSLYPMDDENVIDLNDIELQPAGNTKKEVSRMEQIKEEAEDGDFDKDSL